MEIIMNSLLSSMLTTRNILLVKNHICFNNNNKNVLKSIVSQGHDRIKPCSYVASRKFGNCAETRADAQLEIVV